MKVKTITAKAELVRKQRCRINSLFMDRDVTTQTLMNNSNIDIIKVMPTMFGLFLTQPRIKGAPQRTNIPRITMKELFEKNKRDQLENISKSEMTPTISNDMNRLPWKRKTAESIASTCCLAWK